MKVFRKVVSVLLIIFLNFLNMNMVFAKGSGTSSLNFLKIGVGPRAVAMGDAYVSLSDEVNGLYWNPSGLAYSRKWETGFSHNMWFEEISQDFIGVVTPQYKWGGLGCSVLYLSTGDIDARDRDDNELSNVKASDTLGMLSYMKKIKKTGIGVNLKYLNEKLADKTVTGYAVDIGAKTKINKSLNLGMSVQNIGEPIKFEEEEDDLPLIFRLGASYKYKNFIFSSDGIQDEVKFRLGAGCEYEVNRSLKIRGGYKTGESLGGGVRVGFGIDFKGFDLDYAFAEYGALGYVHRMGIRKKIGRVYKELRIRRGIRRYIKRYLEAIHDAMTQYPDIIKAISSNRIGYQDEFSDMFITRRHYDMKNNPDKVIAISEGKKGYEEGCVPDYVREKHQYMKDNPEKVKRIARKKRGYRNKAVKIYVAAILEEIDNNPEYIKVLNSMSPKSYKKEDVRENIQEIILEIENDPKFINKIKQYKPVEQGYIKEYMNMRVEMASLEKETRLKREKAPAPIVEKADMKDEEHGQGQEEVSKKIEQAEEPKETEEPKEAEEPKEVEVAEEAEPQKEEIIGGTTNEDK